jgi:hypothetical protein
MVAYSFNKRFIEPILVGLGERRMHHVEPKRQTIRAVGRRRHARPGEMLQLYTGMRTRACKKIGEAECVSVEPIHIFVEMGKIVLLGRRETIEKPGGLDRFAQSDGFKDWIEMRQFWRDEHGDLVRLGPFVGVLIRWEPIHG